MPTFLESYDVNTKLGVFFFPVNNRVGEVIGDLPKTPTENGAEKNESGLHLPDTPLVLDWNSVRYGSGVLARTVKISTILDEQAFPLLSQTTLLSVVKGQKCTTPHIVAAYRGFEEKPDFSLEHAGVATGITWALGQSGVSSYREKQRIPAVRISEYGDKLLGEIDQLGSETLGLVVGGIMRPADAVEFLGLGEDPRAVLADLGRSLPLAA